MLPGGEGLILGKGTKILHTELDQGREKMLFLKRKPRGVGFGLPRAGIGTQLNWHLVFSFLFPTKLSIKTNTFLSHAQFFFFLKVRSPHFPGFDLAKDFKKLSVHSVQLNTSNKSLPAYSNCFRLRSYLPGSPPLNSSLCGYCLDLLPG